MYLLYFKMNIVWQLYVKTFTKLKHSPGYEGMKHWCNQRHQRNAENMASRRVAETPAQENKILYFSE